MAMSTRRMKDKGKGKIGDMEVQELVNTVTLIR